MFLLWVRLPSILMYLAWGVASPAFFEVPQTKYASKVENLDQSMEGGGALILRLQLGQLAYSDLPLKNV